MRLRSEEGNAMITVVIASFVIVGLAAIVLGSGGDAVRSAARGQNFDVALGTAEAGVDQAIAKIEAAGGAYSGSFTGQTREGSYSVTVTQTSDGYTLESTGTVGGAQLGRSRRLRITLGPPASFPYALFSDTSIELKNNDTITGDVWANENIIVRQNGTVDGSITAAQSWVEVESGATVTGYLWSGGYNTAESWALNLGGNSTYQSWVKASVSEPADPETCGGEPQSGYKVATANGASIAGDLTTWGVKTGDGTVGGAIIQNACTEAAVPKPLPTFSFNANNYDPATYHEFATVADFDAWLSSNLTDLHGTIYIAEPDPSQTNRVDLSGAVVTGDLTIVSEAPVFTNGISDSGSTERTFVLMSRYAPPPGSSCDVNQDSSECAIHVKNDFQTSCVTAVLIYAPNGPAAVKNNAEMCGSIYADSILVKNNQDLTYTDRVGGVVGFGDETYVIRRWEELAS